MCCVCAAWLFATPWHVSPPGRWVHGIFQARILEWVPFPTPGYLPDPGIAHSSLASSALAGRFFTTALPGKPLKQAWSPSKHKTLCDHTGQKPMNTLPRTYSLALPNHHLWPIRSTKSVQNVSSFHELLTWIAKWSWLFWGVFLFCFVLFSFLDVDHSSESLLNLLQTVSVSRFGFLAASHVGSQSSNQELNPHPLHWKVKSQLLNHKRSPMTVFFLTKLAESTRMVEWPWRGGGQRVHCVRKTISGWKLCRQLESYIWSLLSYDLKGIALKINNNCQWWPSSKMLGIL